MLVDFTVLAYQRPRNTMHHFKNTITAASLSRESTIAVCARETWRDARERHNTRQVSPQ